MIKVITISLLSLGLAACSEQQLDPSQESMQRWTDPETGCVYLTYFRKRAHQGYSGMTARLLPDGTPDCPDVSRPDVVE